MENGGREMSDGRKERARARSSEQARDVSLKQSKHIHANAKVFAPPKKIASNARGVAHPKAPRQRQRLK